MEQRLPPLSRLCVHPLSCIISSPLLNIPTAVGNLLGAFIVFISLAENTSLAWLEADS